MIEQALGDLSATVQIEVFEPKKILDDKAIARSVETLEMIPGRAALVMLIDGYLSGQRGTTGALPEAKVHELMYFLKAAGEDLRLRYSERSEGLYAKELSRVLSKMKGQWIEESGESLKLMPRAHKTAKDFLKNQPDAKDRIERVCQLINGYETPSGLELLATIHWLIQEKPRRSVGDLIDPLHKKGFYRKQVEQAYRSLEEMGWVPEGEKSDRTTEEKPAPTVEMDVSPDMVSGQVEDSPPSNALPPPIDVNTATVDVLQSLPGIGKKRADAIIERRKTHGPFTYEKDITSVPGIGKGLCKKIADWITFGEHEPPQPRLPF